MDDQARQMMRGLRLLVVDDNSVNRTLLAALAANLGAECDTGQDGNDAISLALDHAYDCIILDLHMPEVDGYTAARAIRQLSDAPPLIAFSADRDAETEAAVREAGFVGMLHKPLSEKRLAQVVSDAISGLEVADAGDPGDSPNPDAGPYDRAAAIEAAGGNTALAAELFEMLRSDLKEKRESLGTLDGERVRQIELVHQVHGAASHCRAEPLRWAAGRLECELRREDTGSERESLLAHRHQEFLKCIDEILALPNPFGGTN